MCPRFLNEIKSFSKIDFRTKLILSFVVELILVVKKKVPDARLSGQPCQYISLNSLRFGASSLSAPY